MSDNQANYPEEPPSDRFRRLTKGEEEHRTDPDVSGVPVSQPDQEPAPNDDRYTGQGLTQAWSADEDESGSSSSESQETVDKVDDNQPPSQFVSLYPEIRPPDRQAQPTAGETRPAIASQHEKPTVPALHRDQSTIPAAGQETRSENKTHSIYTHPTVPSPSGIDKTPPRGLPALGTQGMPLPRRVDEIDMDATRVAPSAYSSTPRYRPAPVPAPTSPHIVRPAIQPRKRLNWQSGFGCLLRMVILGLFALVLLALLGGTFILYQYYSIAATLPSVEDLRQRASQFETTRILDRNGNVLYEILDPKAGRRTYIKLNRISPYLIAATIATEDKEYYSHPGFDPIAIVRAFYQNTQGGNTVVSGASTITQQLARALLFTPEERVEQSYMRKVREAILAAEITRRYSKDEILELYLNEIYYGNMAYGIEAAAETYFGTNADKLDLAQAAFLAGLPQTPSVYDVYTKREVTLHRMNDVLVLMIQASREQGCIYVSNSPERICVDQSSALAAFNEMAGHTFKAPEVNIRYPHWVNYIRSILESQYDSQTIYRSGFTVYTTLDPGLQDAAQQIVKEQVDKLTDKHVTDGALVAIQPKTGEILAMVGSADFYNEAIAGQVNMAVSPRQPGSSIKPLTYTAAFEKGWTPATLIWDVPSEFPPSGDPNDTRPPYIPVNYDGRFHGPVTVRTALANSYNIPAVKTLQFIGVYDNPNNPGGSFISMAKRLGITTLTRSDYGLALTLGGGEVSLLEFTGAYATFANNGLRVPPYAITKIADYSGNIVYQYQPPPPQQVIRPEHAFLITSILSDNEARAPMFGTDSVLNLPFTAAAKTGTTNDFRDNWTMGYTPDLAVGVWVGNADYTPMEHTTGVTGAAPIWADFMQVAIQQLTGGNPTPFVKPAGVVERVICAVSGTDPSQWCPSQRREFFAADQPPLPKEQDLWTKVVFDTWTGLKASDACQGFTKEDFAINVTDPWAIKWLKDNPDGQAWAQDNGFPSPIRTIPARECKSDDPRPQIAINSPGEGQTINTSPIDIVGKIDATSDFNSYRLDYGLGNDPVEWKRLARSNTPVSQPDKIYSWDVSQVPAGPVTLRILMRGSQDNSAEFRLHLNLQVPTPTPTPVPTPTTTPTLFPTTVPTNTPVVTPTLPPAVTPTLPMPLPATP